MAERELYPDGEQRRRIMDFIMAAGQTLLENGAEVFRVEQTMEIMAASFHLREFHVYVLTNGIFASAGTAEMSEVRNVPTRTTHLGRVAAVNQLSRQIASGEVDTIDVAETRLAQARCIPFPKDWVQLAAGMGGAFCFALIFGGDLKAGLAAAAAGVAANANLLFCGRHGVGGGFRTISTAALITLCCILGCSLLGTEASHAIIGTLMILTPGIAFTMGNPGLCAGRLPVRHHPDDRRAAHCGQHRHRCRPCAEPLCLFEGGGRGMTELLFTGEQLGRLALQFLLAGAGTLSFAILFACPRRTLPYCGLVGAVGWLVYEIAELFGMEAFAASLLAVIPLTLLARILAMTLRAPVTVFLLTGIFPLVPGAGIYYSAYYFIQGDNALALANGISTFKIAVALAVGIALVLGIPLPQKRR